MTSSFCFADFELRASQRLLMQNGQALQTGGRALDLLIALVAQRHRVMAKAELLDLCWPGQAVEPNNLAVQVWALRRLLGEHAISTVPGRGYQFTATLATDAPQALLNTPVAPASAGKPPWPALSGAATQLFGRQDQLVQLRQALSTHRLLTLLGPSGVGKTRLALVLAQIPEPAWADGAVVVDLATLTQPEALADALRQALGVVPSPQRGLAVPWAQLLADRRLLLVLDNCERVSQAVAAAVQGLLAEAPMARVLVTSQQPLYLPAEQRWPVPPLPVPPEAADGQAAELPHSAAVALLLARVQALAPAFAFDAAGLACAAALCRQLDGLPLAIELAAVRVPLLGLQGVRDLLADRFRLLASAAGHASLHPAQRHTSLHAALSWSHALLTPQEQQLFRRLGVFCGGFSVGLAQAVGRDAGTDDWAVLDLLASLADKSLIVLDPRDPPRWRLLDSTRLFALQQLAEAGELQALRARHAGTVQQVLSATNQALQQGALRLDQAICTLRAELDNLRAAMAWALDQPDQAVPAIAMATAAWPMMMFMGLHSEVLRWMNTLQDRLDQAPPPMLGFFLLGQGKLALRSAMAPRQRLALIQRAEALLSSQGLTEFQLGAMQAQAQTLCQLGEPGAAIDCMVRARSLISPGHAPAYHADLAIWRAIACVLAGQGDEAEALYQQALLQCRADGDEEFFFLVLTDLAELELLLGHTDSAALRWRGLVDAATARRLHSHVMGPLLINLCAALLAQARPAEAQAVAPQALHHLALLGAAREGCHVHAWLAAQQGRWAAAARLIGAGDRFIQQAGEQRLLFEPQARAAAWARLASAAAPAQIERWRTEGEALDDISVAASVAQPG